MIGAPVTTVIRFFFPLFEAFDDFHNSLSWVSSDCKSISTIHGINARIVHCQKNKGLKLWHIINAAKLLVGHEIDRKWNVKLDQATEAWFTLSEHAKLQNIHRRLGTSLAHFVNSHKKQLLVQRTIFLAHKF